MREIGSMKVTHFQAGQKAKFSVICLKQICAFESHFSNSRILSEGIQQKGPCTFTCELPQPFLFYTPPAWPWTQLILGSGRVNPTPQSFAKAISLPLKLVSEQSWLVFTLSLQGWRRLRWPDTVLNQASENKKCL